MNSDIKNPSNKQKIKWWPKITAVLVAPIIIVFVPFGTVIVLGGLWLYLSTKINKTGENNNDLDS